tara:strand:+ start:104 stop:385 length:282 start_codon:yes stop_codon:yes gene_type:complete
MPRKTEKHWIPSESYPNKGPRFGAKMAKQSANQINPRRIKLTIQKDQYGMFWNVTIETKNFVTKAALDYEPDVNDPEIRQMARQLVNLERRAR